MSFNISKFNFLTIGVEDIIYFGDLVDEGVVKDFEIKEIFKKIKSNTSNEEDAKILIKNIIIASKNVHSKRRITIHLVMKH